MSVGSCLSWSGLPSSGGPALGQTLAAHGVADGSRGCWKLLLTPGHLKQEEVDLCCSPSLLLSVESPTGHLPQ